MSEHTKIAWCDSTWNVVTGCSPVSAGCAHCYAARMARRGLGDFSRAEADLRPFSDVRCHPERLAMPLHWRRPRRVFVCSMGDLFHEQVDDEFIAAAFGVMAACPQHTFLVLTKRPERMRRWHEWTLQEAHRQRAAGSAPNIARTMIEWAADTMGGRQPRLGDAWRGAERDPWPLINALLGVSAEDQAAADERIPVLVATPAAWRFASCEPLLGPVDLTGYLGRAATKCAACGLKYGHDAAVGGTGCRGLDWVVAGAESGPGRRTAPARWFRSLRDQCAAASVPFFLKQGDADIAGEMTDLGGRFTKLPLLDGRRWAEFPR